MIKTSPTVVSEENEAFRGSISKITPTAARTIPTTFTERSFSTPRIAPTVRVKIGIVTESSEAFDALVSDSPRTKNIWFSVTPKRLRTARRA